MHKYVAVAAAVLSLALFSPAHAIDNFNPKANILTIPAVSVGDTIYHNVTVKLVDFSVLSVDPGTTTGLPIYEDSNIRIDMGGAAKTAAPSDKTRWSLSFSLLLTNKTSNQLLLAGTFPVDAPSTTTIENTPALADDKGTVCQNVPLLGINNLLKDKNSVASNYTVVSANGTKLLGVDSTKAKTACYFAGAIFSYDSYLWLFDPVANKASLIVFGFNYVAIS